MLGTRTKRIVLDLRIGKWSDFFKLFIGAMTSRAIGFIQSKTLLVIPFKLFLRFSVEEPLRVIHAGHFLGKPIHA